MPWAAILLTVAAATGNNVGKALQKEATRSLPRFSLDPGIARQYLRSRAWLAGLASDLGGAVLMVAAFSLAPVSLVQPVSGVGLVTLAIFSHYYLQETLTPAEWCAAALAAAGTVGLGTSSVDPPAAGAASAVSAPRVLLLVVLLLAMLGASVAARYRRRQQGRRPAASAGRAGAYMYGLQAGACFGLSAAACRTGFLLSSRHALFIPAGLLVSIGLTSSGFGLQTMGLKDGNTVVVCTCAAVSSMATGVLVGLLALGERMPASSAARAVILASWLAIALGVSGLANGPGGAKALLAVVITRMPAWVWPRLPPQTALGLRSFARRHATETRLPVVAVLPEHPGSSAPLPRRWSASPKADLLRAYSGYTAARSPTASSKSRAAWMPATRSGALAVPADAALA